MLAVMFSKKKIPATIMTFFGSNSNSVRSNTLISFAATFSSEMDYWLN
jgi:hypothetical protein